MYRNILPYTGAGTLIFGLTENQMIAWGMFIFIAGIGLFKLLRFKAKDSKN